MVDGNASSFGISVFVGSLVGWVLELVYRNLKSKDGKWINPGFCTGPYVPLYGVAVLIGGLSKVQLTMDMLREKNSRWWWGAISAVISIICALVMLNNPFSSTVVLWWVTGISLIVEPIFDMITLIFLYQFLWEDIYNKAENQY